MIPCQRNTSYFELGVFTDQNCHERIRLNGRQQKSTGFCSSCATHIKGELSAPVIQIELPELTQLTGIFVQNLISSEQNPVRLLKI